MKTKFILIILVVTVISVLASAQTTSEDDPTTPSASPNAMAPGTGPADAPSAVESLEPKQALQGYGTAMIAVSQNFSRQLLGIAEAVQQGKMSSEEGKSSSAEQYLLAQMQLQLLSAWREMEGQDLDQVDKTPVPDEKSEVSPTDNNGIVVVELPFSSFELTDGVAEHLALTKSQKEAIQQVMTRTRRQMEPLMAQSRTIREKLLAFDPQHANKKEIKTLADAQAALLARFIVANASMQSEIYKLLTPEQQRKLDGLKSAGE
jgi:LTXXQ motif family protein